MDHRSEGPGSGQGDPDGGPDAPGGDDERSDAPCDGPDASPSRSVPEPGSVPTEALFESLPDPALLVDVETMQVVEANEAATDLWGYDGPRLVGTEVPDLHPEGEGERYRELIRRTAATGEMTAARIDEAGGMDLLTAAGERVPVEVSARPVEFGGRDYVLGTFRDVSNRERRERVLERLHGATRRLVRADSRQAVADVVSEVADEVLNLSLHSVMLYDPGRDVLETAARSEAAAETFGSIAALEPGEGIVWKAFETGEPLVYGDVREDPDVYDPDTDIRSEFVVPIGEYGVFLASSTVVDDFDATDVSLGKVLAANAEAALRRLERERALDDQNRQLRTIVDNAPLVLFAFDPDGTFTLSEGKGLEPLGLEPGEAVGESIFEMYADNERVLSAARRALDGEMVQDTQEVGNRVYETWYRPIFEAPGEDGADREVVEVIGTSMEVTERERRERLVRVLNRFLRHNLRNAMDVMVGYAERLEDHPDDRVRDAVDRIESTGDELTRLSEKARRLGQMAREEGETDVVDVRRSLERIADDLEAVYDADLELEGVAGRRLPVDEPVTLALGEVCENAVKHADAPDPTARVSVSVRESPRRAVVEVVDEGPGIPDHERAALEAERETPLRHGSGLGLFVAYWAVTDAGGEIDVEDASDPDAGSVVTVSVPVVDDG